MPRRPLLPPCDSHQHQRGHANRSLGLKHLRRRDHDSSTAFAKASLSTILNAFLIAMTGVAFGKADHKEAEFDHEQAETITSAEAKECCKLNGVLRFHKLQHLEPDAAETLANHRHGLAFEALAGIEPATARALSRCKKPLGLNAVAELNDQAAAALATSNARLSLLLSA